MEGGFASYSGREKAKKKNKKFSIPGNTADFMNGKNTYHKENGVWKQRNK
ncbi:hypothetical protein [Bacillus cereus group sp. BfR-BA-00967]|nr:hypothetical protein [Bacillus cereus group sp. BfR-BA-00967]MDX5928706.1 hypothetical protein [Bacillus cereus group sp. BfR-BA-00967]